MKSKTILPEKERINQGKYNNFNYPLLVEKYHQALVAAEEEIVELRSILQNKLTEEVKDRGSLIERLHYENQTLIEENAGLKAKVEKLEDCEELKAWLTENIKDIKDQLPVGGSLQGEYFSTQIAEMNTYKAVLEHIVDF